MGKNICVYCSSSDAVDEVYFETARSLGNLIALKGHNLVYGGATVGLMGALADSAYDNNARIIGIMPEALMSKGITFNKADEFIITKDLRDRKARMEAVSDAFIALPGGFGTLEEILEILTLKQLQIHNKPVILINTDNFYDSLFDLFEKIYDKHFAKSDYRSLYYITEDADSAISYIESYTPPQLTSKWFNH